MKDNRKRHSATFKSTVVLDVLRGDRTIAEIAQHYAIHPTQIGVWKKTFLAGAHSVFEDDSKDKDASAEKIAYLERKIGQLTIEHDFLKKSWAKCQS